MPNKQKNIIIKKINEYILTTPNYNNLVIVEDFNFITNELNKSLLYKDNNQITNV